MLSVLARQLERYRDLTCVWREQRDALRLAVARREQVLHQGNVEVDFLRQKQEEMEQAYAGRLKSLREGLGVEKAQLEQEAADTKSMLDTSLEEEEALEQKMKDLHKRNGCLRETLGRAMSKLNTVKTAMSQYQAEMAAVDRDTMNAYFQKSPQLAQALLRVDGLVGEKEKVHNDTLTVRAQILQVQDELNKQRSQTLTMENFIRKIANPSNGYILEPGAKREASALLHKASKMREACARAALESP